MLLELTGLSQIESIEPETDSAELVQWGSVWDRRNVRRCKRSCPLNETFPVEKNRV